VPAVEVAAADERAPFVADRQPGLGDVRLGDVVGAPGPPVFVGTHPGFTALLEHPCHRRVTAAVKVASNSLPAESACAPFHGRRSQSRSSMLGVPPRCIPLLR
jgi:hypothetical protein